MISPNASRIALDIIRTREPGTELSPAQLQREVAFLLDERPVGTSHPWRVFLASCARAGRLRGLGGYRYVTI